MGPRPIRAVLFDFSDTLFHQDRSTRAVAIAAAQGIVLDPDLVARVTHRIKQRSMTSEEVAKGRDLSAQRHRECWIELYRPLDDLAPGLGGDPLSVRMYDDATTGRSSVPYPDTAAVIDALVDRGVRLGVVSDIGWDVRRAFLHHGLADRFSVFVASYAHGFEKPDRRLFQAACDVLGVALDETLMVGDNAQRDGGAVQHGLRAYVLPPWPGDGDRGLMVVPAIVDASHGTRR